MLSALSLRKSKPPMLSMRGVASWMILYGSVYFKSTSKGVMTDKEAKAQNVGGEVLCNIY